MKISQFETYSDSRLVPRRLLTISCSSRNGARWERRSRVTWDFRRLPELGKAKSKHYRRGKKLTSLLFTPLFVPVVKHASERLSTDYGAQNRRQTSDTSSITIEDVRNEITKQFEQLLPVRYCKSSEKICSAGSPGIPGTRGAKRSRSMRGIQGVMGPSS